VVRSRFFLKAAGHPWRKKLLLLPSRAFQTIMAQNQKVFLLLFLQKKQRLLFNSHP
jgi:hypothetical protein